MILINKKYNREMRDPSLPLFSIKVAFIILL
jgi:hypothetical protein